ncbi:hypothetical protein EHS13_33890 [Paenibacillus psychroresistens]|uniref:Uncharacterized protein n=1 Tax=Paenibacillus psychroresistens TaxID=1778678 RepID=A0A6B8RUP5_9BACL|nr:hypothetical protein [Paenibacillus psychroresistens]QGQ99499.1 hypothetical protein EHS13_33890 [Paenibacillus psychroresistens]
MTDQQALNRASLPLIGAIRWDAWFPGNTYPGFVDPLLYTAYDFRKPFYGWFNSGIPEHAEIMDQEIDYASEAKLDFWAFVWYPENDEHPGIAQINGCLNDYMSSAKHHLMQFCLVLQTGWVAGKHLGSWRELFVPEFVEKMRDPQYVKVEGNRPLLFWMDTEFLDSVDKGFGCNWREELDYLTEQLLNAGMGKPFLVDMRHDYASALRFGLDGISDYGPASIKLKGHHAYAALAAHDREKLESSHGLQIVPGIGAAIDPRPRDLGEWTLQTGIQYGFSFELPTHDEWLEHLKSTCEWVQQNEKKAGSPGIVCIYSWNEIDEGGPGIVPTEQEGTYFLDAIYEVKTGKTRADQWNRVNDSNPMIVYKGEWESIFPHKGCYCNDITSSDAIGSSFSYTFNGTELRLIGGKGPDYGMLEVEIDSGKVRMEVDLYNIDAQPSIVLCSIGGLPAGKHILKAMLLKKHNWNSLGHKATLDAVHFRTE